MNNISHQAVQIHGRSLHCLRLGSGPAIVLLHESPRSSAVLLPLALALCDRFTVFAVDTPGYGASDPLPERRPTIDDFADAIAASLSALGLERFAVYGTHTGATIAAALARRHPEIVSGAILDGYPVFARHEQDLNAYHYFPSFEVRWDGTHVAALWSRVRDQYTFFPWWQPGRDSRIPRTPPLLANHHAAIRDILSSADYATGYNAAFRIDGREALSDIIRPVHLICRADDTLFPHLDRLGDMPTMAIERLGADRGQWAERIGEIFTKLAQTDAPAPTNSIAGTPTGALVALSPDLLARIYDSGERLAPPLVLIADLPGQASDWADLARSEARRRQVIALELPGAGLSRGSDALDGSIEAMVDFLLAALDRHGIDRFDLAGRGLGGLLAQRLAAARPGGTLLLLDPPPAEAAEAPAKPEPDWHGGYLMSLWYEARDAMLFRPGRSRGADSLRELGPGIDLAAMQSRFVCAVRSEPALDKLASALHVAAKAWPEASNAHASVVLREHDGDNDALIARLLKMGTRVVRASHDGLTAAASDAVRHPD